MVSHLRQRLIIFLSNWNFPRGNLGTFDLYLYRITFYVLGSAFKHTTFLVYANAACLQKRKNGGSYGYDKVHKVFLISNFLHSWEQNVASDLGFNIILIPIVLQQRCIYKNSNLTSLYAEIDKENIFRFLICTHLQFYCSKLAYDIRIFFNRTLKIHAITSFICTFPSTISINNQVHICSKG